MTKGVEPTETTSTVQKYRENMKIQLSKWARGYWGFWLLDLPAASIFPRPDQFLRADYLTYFERHNCSSDWAEFNASEIMEKHAGLI